MQDVLEEIREQIHEVRNLCGPFDLKLSALEERVTRHHTAFETKSREMETMIANNSFKIADILERIKRIEATLKIAPGADIPTPVPVHEDKESPAILPPQKPGP